MVWFQGIGEQPSNVAMIGAGILTQPVVIQKVVANSLDPILQGLAVPSVGRKLTAP